MDDTTRLIRVDGRQLKEDVLTGWECFNKVSTIFVGSNMARLFSM